MYGKFSPERLDIVVDNPSIHFPGNVEYHFMFEEHEATRATVAVDMVKSCDVYAPEFPNVYTNLGEDSVDKLVFVANQIMGGQPSVEDDEWLRTFHLEDNAPVDGDDGRCIDLYEEINTYKNTGIIFRPIDSISPDPEKREMSWSHDLMSSYAYNPFWLMSGSPARDSLMLRQLAAIGWEQHSERETTRIGVTCGSGHWPLAIGAKYLGANVKKAYTNKAVRDDCFDASLLPYYRERFTGNPVISPQSFLQKIYPFYRDYINDEEYNSVLPLLQT